MAGRRATFVTLIMAGSLLISCAPPGARGPVARLATTTSEAQLSYAFPPGSDTLSARERSRIASYLNGFGLTRQDVLVVSIPAGGRPGSDDRRLRGMTRMLSGWPARLRFVTGMEERVPAHIGIIRILRATGVSADCGDGAAVAGCASARNLAAQIGNPADTLMPEKASRYLPPTAATSGPAPDGAPAAAIPPG